VNFATADWLPHGGVGAELYRRYHKAPVLSHEELLFVVAKNGIDAKELPYLTGELERVFQKEKKHREDLWVGGVLRSKSMSPKMHPEHVGTEEVHILANKKN
jgi:[histone H3]-trimethyl-L-lysine4 demethylase